MKRTALMLAGAIALIASAASASSAKAADIYFTCNSDGFIHIHIDNEAGQSDTPTIHRCGPGLMIANVDVISVVIGRESRIPARANAFLTHIERGRAGLSSTGAAPSPRNSRRIGAPTLVIYMTPRQVRRNLGTYLSSVDPRWRELPAGEPSNRQ